MTEVDGVHDENVVNFAPCNKGSEEHVEIIFERQRFRGTSSM